MESHKTIGFDLDDVLLDFNTGFSLYHNNLYGTAIERHHIKSSRLEEIYQGTKEEIQQRVLDFYHTSDHWVVLPVAGAVDTTKALSQKYSLNIVSAKPDYLREKTLTWLEQHFSRFDQVYFTNQFHGDQSRKRTKPEICLELGINIFVDDSLRQAKDLAAAGIEVLLFDCPWNQSEPMTGVTRVHSWQEILDKLD